MAEDTGKQVPATTGKIEELIAGHFPKLDSSEITELAAGFENLDDKELEAVLHAGKGALRRGMRVLIAYLGAAPYVYRTLGENEFENWLALARDISKLSVSCCEGFFDSSLAIIEKGGLELLENWTKTGIALSEQNKWMAIAYFKHTGKVVISTEPARFQELVGKGEIIGKVNVKVAEAYFEHLWLLHSLLTTENFALFCHITGHIIKVHWLTAIELINIAVKTLPAVRPSRREELLSSMENILEMGEAPAIALLRNAGPILEKANENDLETLVTITMDIATTDSESAKVFLDTIPQYLDILELKEVEEWKDKAISAFPANKTALRNVIPSSLALGDHYDDTNKDARSILIDKGIQLADIQPECILSYFENASLAYNILSSDMFEEWIGTGEGIAIQGPELGSSYYRNSVLTLSKIESKEHEEIFSIANTLLKKEGALSSTFFEFLGPFVDRAGTENTAKWAEIGLKVYSKDRKLALDYFSHSPSLLEKLDIGELEEWTLKGLEAAEEKKTAGKAYFSLESKSSRELVEELTGAVALKKVANVLRYYALGLSGSNFVIRSMAALPLQIEAEGMNPIIAGNTIYLAPGMGIYQDTEDNFKIYKLSVMHEVGHVRFTSLDVPQENVNALAERIRGKYPAPTNEEATEPDQNNEDIDPVDLLSLFPNQILAATIFGVLEDARVEYVIMDHYKGVRSDLEDVRHRMLLMRPVPEEGLERFMEALLWVTTGHEPEFELEETVRSTLDRVREELNENIFNQESSTFSSLELAFGIYSMIEEVFGPLEQIKYMMIKNIGYRGMDVGAAGPIDPMMTKPYENVIKNFIPETETDLTAEEDRPKEQATDRPTQAMEKNWKLLGRYKYDEWDSTINDYRSEWSTINEIEPVGGSTAYYNKAMERYSNEISLLKHTFGLMKPEVFHRLKQQNDGTEIDIDAFTESLIAKKCGVNPDEGLYIRWDKHERDVATLFLMDVSASTRKVLGADGRSILEVEKDALIIMSQALESIGDNYAIYAFSGKSREAVEYFVIKEFDEKLSDDVARRISILQPASNTRLGPAIRHSIKKLEHAGASTKMLVLLSDGEPYDRSKGEDSYQGDIAQEDTRVAIAEGKNRGMHFFCITVDKNPGDYLDNIFSDVGYTIIDDALMLPETLPLLYKRLTT
ncbi:nitric oxide reductase activation protein NorD [Methanolobus profundi]|uniref:von Willebrand factor type A domain-containing protein n=1 Tax=Methanolobus profundi TaxID=487685 RepID=A0A1I4SVH2_9EURY|nr:VWA domain-containing protein [Methanolobus profundi]SFM68283.1 von Willebrand factor type A domain-containing protein [Methanolobus profundi]